MRQSDEDYIFTTDETSATAILYKGSGSKIIVPNTLGGKPLKTIESTCFNYSNVSAVKISEGVENIL